jgi:hypothetical protein
MAGRPGQLLIVMPFGQILNHPFFKKTRAKNPIYLKDSAIYPPSQKTTGLPVGLHCIGYVVNIHG